MTENFTIKFDLRRHGKVETSANPADIWPDWKGKDERWLFVAPHDDDIVCGAGLTFISSIECGIDTYAIVSTTGEAGYCRLEQRNTIASIRREECKKSFEFLGLPKNNLIMFNYPDAHLPAFLGHKLTDDPNDKNAVAGATGLQNSYVCAIRKLNPSRVFLPALTDIHPDHKTTHTEFVMSIFHAQGRIWPELGPPIQEIPKLYEYATYCDFITPPEIRIRTSRELLEKKIAAIEAYASQEQIELLVSRIRTGGPQEYIRELEFNIIEPGKYDSLFDL